MTSRFKQLRLWLLLITYFGILYIMGTMRFHVENLWRIFPILLIVMSLLLILAFDRIDKKA